MDTPRLKGPARAKAQKMLSLRRSYTGLHALVLVALALILPHIQAVPYHKDTHTSIAVSSGRPHQYSHNAPTARVPGRLRARTGPWGQANRPGVVNTMKHVPGSFRALATVLPVKEAAAALEDFFMDLHHAVTATWANSPRRRVIVYTGQGFSLLISARGDTIPWDFIAQIAFNAWEGATRGFTELWDVMYSNADGSILVNLSLRLLNHVLSGPDSGSSSQDALTHTDWDGSDWREGSVPSVGSGADAGMGTR
ncbi:MAG: hypothetical protein Q9213_001206 [Squamulea squamosa]